MMMKKYLLLGSRSTLKLTSQIGLVIVCCTCNNILTCDHCDDNCDENDVRTCDWGEAIYSMNYY